MSANISIDGGCIEALEDVRDATGIPIARLIELAVIESGFWEPEVTPWKVVLQRLRETETHCDRDGDEDDEEDLDALRLTVASLRARIEVLERRTLPWIIGDQPSIPVQPPFGPYSHPGITWTNSTTNSKESDEDQG